MNRRSLIQAACVTAAAAPVIVAPTWCFASDRRSPTSAQSSEFWRRPRRVRLTHATGEKIDTVYWSDGQMIRSAHEELSHFMRDRVVQRGVYMHPVLLDILYAVNGWLGYFQMRNPIVLNSGYRDPHRNALIEGAARNSTHIKGQAADIRIPGVATDQLSAFGRWLSGGGVGWYVSKGFVHLDCGHLRQWRG